MKYGAKILLIFFTLMISINQSGQAEEKSSVATLPEVTVLAVNETRALTVPSISQAQQDLGRVAGGTDLIEAEQYKKGKASTLAEALGFSPGVYIQPRFGAEEARLSIRGSGLQRTFHLRGIKLLQDGVSMNQADGGGDFQAIDLLALQYIEVFRGANALRYGSTTLGGAINFVSPTGHDVPLVHGRFETGSFGHLRDQVSSGAVKGPFDYFISLSEFRQDGFRHHSDQWTRRVFSNYGVRWGDEAETRLYLNLVDSKSKLPGNLTKAQMKDSPRQANASNITGNQKRDFDLVHLAQKTTFTSENSSLDLGAYWIRKDLFHPIFQVLDVISNDFGGSLRYTQSDELAGHENILTLGFNPSFGVTDDLRHTNTGGDRGTRTAESKQYSYNLDFYAEDEFYLKEQLALVSGLQGTYASRSVRDKFRQDGENDGHRVYRGISPKAGLRYDVNEQSQVFANFSRSFEPPSFGELSNVSGAGIRQLKAQEASTLEFGSRGESGRLAWDAAYYFSWVNGELLSLNDGAGNPLGTVNARRTFHQGIEAGLGYDLLQEILAEKTDEPDTPDKVTLRGVYNWSRFRFEDDPAFGNNLLPGIPAHFMRVELMYAHPSGFYLGPNLEWALKKYSIDMANSFFASPHALLGIKGGYRAKTGMSFFVEGKNLTNEIYAATTGVIANAAGADSAQFLPGDGRAVYAGIEFRWG